LRINISRNIYIFDVDFSEISDQETASPRVGFITEYRLIQDLKANFAADK